MADDEPVAEAAGMLEQRDVADVEQIEAAVGEDDRLAVGAPLGDALGHSVAVEDLLFGMRRSAGEGGEQLVLCDGHGADLADDDAGGDVGEFDGGGRSGGRRRARGRARR